MLCYCPLGLNRMVGGLLCICYACWHLGCKLLFVWHVWIWVKFFFQGRLYRNRPFSLWLGSRKWNSLVSGPGISVMSEISTGFVLDSKVFGPSPVSNLHIFFAILGGNMLEGMATKRNGVINMLLIGSINYHYGS